MLRTADLNFNFPEELVALKARARGTSRIFHIPRDNNNFREITWTNLMGTFKKGDTLVLNDTQVLWARLIVEKSIGKTGEIFFLKTLTDSQHWQILSRALNLKIGSKINLPGGLRAEVLKIGRISEIKILNPVDLKSYFNKHGHVPLPPYIQNLRASDESDRERYQSVWAKNWGSVAAPTASLHFDQTHLDQLTKQGVKIGWVTLHVGAGTFLPIETETLDKFQIHSETVNVSRQTCDMILQSQAAGKKIWACGTTVLRALESAVWASGKAEGRLPLVTPFFGETRLFVKPGYKFLVVDGLLTNFHQPQSSLLALVSAFATRLPPPTQSDETACLQKILSAYGYAIEKKFRLFSYGDLTVIS